MPAGGRRSPPLEALGIVRLEYFAVFNRWGQRIFYTTEPGSGWNGYFNGTQQPQGGYVWMARGTDYTGRVIDRKGTVVLIR